MNRRTGIWFCLLIAGLFCFPPLAAPQQQRDNRVTLTIEVTDSGGRYVNGLRSGDIRLLEDGIVQKIVRFSRNESVYSISYVPKPNTNRGFRRIHVQILSENGEFRVRHIPGYRPEQLK